MATLNMLKVLRKNFLPNTAVPLKHAGDAGPELSGLGYEKIDGKATACVCENQTCLPPTNKTEQLLKLLGITDTTYEAENAASRQCVSFQ